MPVIQSCTTQMSGGKMREIDENVVAHFKSATPYTNFSLSRQVKVRRRAEHGEGRAEKGPAVGRATKTISTRQLSSVAFAQKSTQPRRNRFQPRQRQAASSRRGACPLHRSVTAHTSPCQRASKPTSGLAQLSSLFGRGIASTAI